MNIRKRGGNEYDRKTPISNASARGITDIGAGGRMQVCPSHVSQK